MFPDEVKRFIWELFVVTVLTTLIMGAGLILIALILSLRG